MMLTSLLAEANLDPWMQVFGRFHLVLLHLPIGLLPAIFVLEIGAMLFRRPIPRGAITTLSVLTAVTAGAAFAAGLVLAAEKVDSATLANHKNFAIAMTICCALLPLLALRKSRRPFRVALAAALALSIATGHLGGTLTHREGFLFKPLERRQNGEGTNGGEQPNGQAPDAGSATEPGTGQQPEGTGAPMTFAGDVMPILKRACNSCHNPDDLEGDLDLTTYKAVMEGWGDDKIVIPGDPANSPMIETLGLPLDDEYHMPPEDEEQLTAVEIATLTRWVREGCPE